MADAKREGEKHMRVIPLALLLIIASAFAVTAQVNVEGNWLGTLDVGVKLRLALKIKKSENSYTAKFDSLDQGANDLPIDSIVLDGNKLTFSAEKLDINYEGTLNEAGNEIAGTFKQGTNSFPLVF